MILFKYLVINAQKENEKFQKLLTESYMKLFTTAIQGVDWSEMKAEHNKNVEELGVNNALGEEFYGSLKSVINKLKDISQRGSSASSEKELKELLKLYVKTTESYIRLQPGLEKFPKDLKLKADPKNKEFFKFFSKLISWTKSIKQSPKSVEEYFNAETAGSYARFTVLLSEMSKGAQNSN